VSDPGYAIVRGVLSEAEVETLRSALTAVGEHAYGVRQLFDRVPGLLDLAGSAKIRQLVERLIGYGPRPVRALLFDKNPTANWKVPWHQDLTIAVAERFEVAGYGPWSIKNGQHHVQPPVALLRTMAAIRIHLDDCGETNGPLRVVPGSHMQGRITGKQIRETVERLGEVTCTVRRGDAIVMSPLLLHASSTATTPSHRRVIHFEYCSGKLPEGLDWAEGSVGATREC
jgi:hypothetical protein